MTNERLNTIMSERFHPPTSAGLRVEIAEALLQDYLALQTTGRTDWAEIEAARSGMTKAVVSAVLLGVGLAAYRWLT
jgi:hypothetical protein